MYQLEFIGHYYNRLLARAVLLFGAVLVLYTLGGAVIIIRQRRELHQLNAEYANLIALEQTEAK